MGQCRATARIAIAGLPNAAPLHPEGVGALTSLSKSSVGEEGPLRDGGLNDRRTPPTNSVTARRLSGRRAGDPHERLSVLY